LTQIFFGLIVYQTIFSGTFIKLFDT